MSIQTVQPRRHPGLRYAGGRGVPESPERAAKWYRAAAEPGAWPKLGRRRFAKRRSADGLGALDTRQIIP